MPIKPENAELVVMFGRPVRVIRSQLVVSPGVREGKADAPFAYVAETVKDESEDGEK